MWGVNWCFTGCLISSLLYWAHSRLKETFQTALLRTRRAVTGRHLCSARLRDGIKRALPSHQRRTADRPELSRDSAGLPKTTVLHISNVVLCCFAGPFLYNVDKYE